ncbi:MAG: hypothetical protein M0Z70_12000 [Nitrospiraceae bacterium]|nr:hypothetical protein [Nitrospiraceae bacterium]
MLKESLKTPLKRHPSKIHWKSEKNDKAELRNEIEDIDGIVGELLKY